MGIKCTIKTFLCERSSLPEEPPAPVGRRTALPPSLTYRVLSKDLYNVMARTQIGSGLRIQWGSRSGPGRQDKAVPLNKNFLQFRLGFRNWLQKSDFLVFLKKRMSDYF